MVTESSDRARGVLVRNAVLQDAGDFRPAVKKEVMRTPPHDQTHTLNAISVR